MGSELHPASYILTDNSNDERHDAALTVAEHSDDMPEKAAYYLTILGLAEENAQGGFSPVGVDEFELSWFTPTVACTERGA